MLVKQRTNVADYDSIFQHLEEVRGSQETRDLFVCEVIREAGKFKRKKLVQELEEWRKGSLRNCSGGGVGNVNRSKAALPTRR